MADKSHLDLPKPWPSFLNDLDAALSVAIQIQCMGGFALMAAYEIPRATGDLDYLITVPGDASRLLEELAGPDSKLATKHRVCVQKVGVADLPEDYASRLAELKLNLKNVRLLALDPYDLVLSKLTRNSPKDREDVKFLAQKLDLGILTLRKLFEREMKPWLPNLARHELTLQIWSEYFPH